MAGNEKLEATLVNNLGTVLRNRDELPRAVALHRSQLARVEARQGLHSSFLILARHNLVDILGALGRFDDAQALLDSQVGKLEGHVEEQKAARAAGQAPMVPVVVATGARLCCS